jgi:quercetin dioxygenase-like cupin family protein
MKLKLEKSIKRLIQIVVGMTLIQMMFIVALNAGDAFSASPSKVDRNGLDIKIQSDFVISGNLTPLNGQYKLRLTRSVFKPGGYLGEHEHVGPGIRFVESGELTSIHPGRTFVYRAGDSFYEPGDARHVLRNNTKAPVQVLNFELLPTDWQGMSAVPLHSAGETQVPPVSAASVSTDGRP